MCNFSPDFNSADQTPAVTTMDSPHELEYDELEYASEDEDPNVFRIRNPVAPSTAEVYSTQSLHNLMHEGMIDLHPPYQRGAQRTPIMVPQDDVVWPEAKQIGLIDSIFRNFYVPPVVFAVQKDEDGESIKICVDGKQRLTSIQKFFDGQIPHRDAVTKKNFWFTSPSNSKSSRIELPEAYKIEFSNKHITCVEYHDIRPEHEREIFQRVQLGMSLTAAEKLQAISSPWAEWISELEARHVSVEGGLSQILKWDTKRGRDFQNIVHVVYCCDGLPNEERIPTAQKIEKWLSREDKPSPEFKDDIEQTFRDFWLIADTKEYNEGFTRIAQRIAPVEFLFIGVLLYQLRKAVLKSKAKAIFIMRNTIRQEFRDVRNNSAVGKAMWGYVNHLRLSPTTRILSRDDAPAASTSQPAKKRKLNAMDDEEFRSEPVRNIGKPVKTRSKGQKS